LTRNKGENYFSDPLKKLPVPVFLLMIIGEIGDESENGKNWAEREEAR
jgi:hypothetical protein